MKKSDLHREYARVIDMCEGTGVIPFQAVKYRGTLSKYFLEFSHPTEDYEFPLAIVESKPVFRGDKLYNRNGSEFTAHKITKFGTGAIVNEGELIGDVPKFCSWTPPKPATITVELLREDAEDIRMWPLQQYESLRNIKEACEKALKGEQE